MISTPIPLIQLAVSSTTPPTAEQIAALTQDMRVALDAIDAASTSISKLVDALKPFIGWGSFVVAAAAHLAANFKQYGVLGVVGDLIAGNYGLAKNAK